MHVKTQSLPQNVYKKTTHTLPGTDTKARLENYIKKGQPKLHHKHTTNKSILWLHGTNYGARENLGDKAITGYDVTHRYNGEQNVQKEQNILSTDALRRYRGSTVEHK